jgi:hypothetical protein
VEAKGGPSGIVWSLMSNMKTDLGNLTEGDWS